ncbi:MAG: sensor histidine kinase, partial [Ferruginibacter sp.]
KQSLIDVERYKTESAVAQLQNLKSQLNPHFLFNNLSVLTSLVYKNQDKAADFINELSKVYRYVLDNNNSELVTLQHELDFLNHYTYLLKIRFENSVSFTINIDENNLLKYLPPICLQMLVENTIQHNEASQAKPLQVNIYTNNDTLIIENNIQARSDFAESSKTGLENLQARYSFFTERKVVIFNNDNIFKVALPLIIRQ